MGLSNVCDTLTARYRTGPVFLGTRKSKVGSRRPNRAAASTEMQKALCVPPTRNCLRDTPTNKQAGYPSHLALCGSLPESGLDQISDSFKLS